MPENEVEELRKEKKVMKKSREEMLASGIYQKKVHSGSCDETLLGGKQKYGLTAM